MNQNEEYLRHTAQDYGLDLEDVRKIADIAGGNLPTILSIIDKEKRKIREERWACEPRLHRVVEEPYWYNR